MKLDKLIPELHCDLSQIVYVRRVRTETNNDATKIKFKHGSITINSPIDVVISKINQIQWSAV